MMKMSDGFIIVMRIDVRCHDCDGISQSTCRDVVDVVGQDCSVAVKLVMGRWRWLKDCGSATLRFSKMV